MDTFAIQRTARPRPAVRIPARDPPRRRRIVIRARILATTDAVRVLAVPAVRLDPTAPPEPVDPAMGAGSGSYLDFRLPVETPGMHTLVIHHEHTGPDALALGLSIDRDQFRTVVYPPTRPGDAARTTTLQVWIPQRSPVIRLGEGRAGARIAISGISLERS